MVEKGELKIQNGKFWMLENRSDEKNIERYLYVDRDAAIDRLKEVMKTVNTDKISLSSVDIKSNGWNIEGVPWALIALGLIRGTISDSDEEQVRKGFEQKVEQKPQQQKK